MSVSVWVSASLSSSAACVLWCAPAWTPPPPVSLWYASSSSRHKSLPFCYCNKLRVIFGKVIVLCVLSTACFVLFPPLKPHAFLLLLLIVDYIQWLVSPSPEAQTLYILDFAARGHDPDKIPIRRKHLAGQRGCFSWLVLIRFIHHPCVTPCFTALLL